VIALVTGATGFIGAALARTLAAKGWEVRVLVRSSSRGRLTDADRYRVWEGDLSSPAEVLQEAAADCDVVFHAAAIRNRWGTTPEEYHRDNVEGTRRLLLAAQDRARRFVYVSSVGVLGNPGVLNIDESFPLDVLAGDVDYHGSKASGELAVRGWRGGIETVIARPTLTYGPGDTDGMMTRLIAMIARGKFLRIGRGENHLHVTHIDDMTRGLILAGTHPAAAGETFILAGPSSLPMREIVVQIEQALGLAPRALYVPEFVARPIAAMVEGAYRLADVLHLPISAPADGPLVTQSKIDMVCAHKGYSSAKASRLLGFEPRVGFVEGLALTLAWMTENGLLPAPLTATAVHPVARS
jgi:nucleoside-diphosphate-sugar epimerase